MLTYRSRDVNSMRKDFGVATLIHLGGINEDSYFQAVSWPYEAPSLPNWNSATTKRYCRITQTAHSAIDRWVVVTWYS